MQLNILRALALVAVGNAALRGRDVSAFWPGDPLFQFSEQVEFVIPRGGDQYDQAAPDPVSWFQWLKQSGRTGLRLHNAPMEQKAGRLGHIEERMLVGMVGGGPRWLIETTGEGLSQVWEGFDRLGDRNAPDRRIWRTAYLMQAETAPQDNADRDLVGAEQDVRAALVDIEALARKMEGQPFAEVFAGAREALNETAATAPAFDFLRLTDLSEAARRLLQASSQAFVFGGMGSWNDMVPEEALLARYNATSEALFVALQRAVIAIANSSYG